MIQYGIIHLLFNTYDNYRSITVFSKENFIIKQYREVEIAKNGFGVKRCEVTCAKRHNQTVIPITYSMKFSVLYISAFTL